jgi:hypothetical protein
MLQPRPLRHFHVVATHHQTAMCFSEAMTITAAHRGQLSSDVFGTSYAATTYQPDLSALLNFESPFPDRTQIELFFYASRLKLAGTVSSVAALSG